MFTVEIRQPDSNRMQKFSNKWRQNPLFKGNVNY